MQTARSLAHAPPAVRGQCACAITFEKRALFGAGMTDEYELHAREYIGIGNAAAGLDAVVTDVQ